MNNKSKKVLMIGAVAAAVAVFATTAWATSPKFEGYEAFKEVLKANQMSGEMAGSATVNGSFTVRVNGDAVLEAEGTTKVADAGDTQSVSSDFGFTVMGVERNGSLYSNSKDKVYLVDRTHDLHYQVVNFDDERERKHQKWSKEERIQGRTMNKAEEALLDYLVGDLKDNFTVKKAADGTKTITVEVSKEEIPLPLRLLMDAASDGNNELAHPSEPSAEWEQMKQFPFFQGLEGINLKEQLPKLTDNLAIERVSMQFMVDRNNELQSVHGKLEVSGKDKAGVAHRVEIEGLADLSDINATTPDVYDTAGKPIEIIDAAIFDDRG